jgi:hypothetical protein
MALNNDGQSKIYINRKIQAQNQQQYLLNGWSEFIRTQQTAYENLSQSIISLEKTMLETFSRELLKWETIKDQLVRVEEDRKVQKEIRTLLKELSKRLDSLEETIGNGETSAQNLSEQLTRLEENYRLMSEEKDQNEQLLTEAKEALGRISEGLKKSDEQFGIHRENLMKRLDNLEGMMDVLSREMRYIRSLIFERTDFLWEKAEKGFQKIVSFFQQKTSSPNKEEEEEQRRGREFPERY